jgi:hypothetical protein
MGIGIVTGLPTRDGLRVRVAGTGWWGTGVGLRFRTLRKPAPVGTGYGFVEGL